MHFPRYDEAIGFDLEIGDWVEPDGKGKSSDMLLTATGQFTDYQNYDFNVSVVFPGDENGMCEFFAKYQQPDYMPDEPLSVLIPPKIAPESGYTNQFNVSIHNSPDIKPGGLYKSKRNTIFKTRTSFDDDTGKTLANYSWTTGGIYVDISNRTEGTFKLNFSYYYNPDPHSRSLEPKEITNR